jgi:hypothetical protein
MKGEAGVSIPAQVSRRLSSLLSNCGKREAEGGKYPKWTCISEDVWAADADNLYVME